MPGLLNRYFQSAWKYAGSLLPSRNVVEILGHATVVDDPVSQTTKLTIIGNRVSDLPATSSVGPSQLVQVSDGASDYQATVSQLTNAISLPNTSGILPPSKGGTGLAATDGIVKYASGVSSLVAAPAGEIVGTTSVQTLTNKTVQMGALPITFGSTPAATGDVRVAYAGSGGARNILVVKDSTGADKSIVTTGPGDSVRFGESGVDYSVRGASGTFTFSGAFSITTAGKQAAYSNGSALFLGTDASYGTQHSEVRTYAVSSINNGIGSTTYFGCDGGSQTVFFSKPIAAGVAADLNGFRLTLSSGNPVPASDVTSSTLYMTPYRSGHIGIYDNTVGWVDRSTSEVALALSGLTAGKNYDVFAIWTGSAVALELGPAWTSDSLRATAIARQDGVQVKSGDATRRYIGTFRATAATTTTDSATQRFLYNEYNQVDRILQFLPGASWTCSQTTIRQANASASYALQLVAGNAVAVQAEISCTWTNVGGSGIVYFPLIGLNQTTTNNGTCQAQSSAGGSGFLSTAAAKYSAVVSGYNSINWLEKTNTTSYVFTIVGGSADSNSIMRGSARM